jgi:two-component system sensor histidine kinase MprB
MSLRLRLMIVTATVVALAVALASAIVYVSMRSDLRRDVDHQLEQRAALIRSRPLMAEPLQVGLVRSLPQVRFGERDYYQFVSDKGKTLRPASEPGAVPVEARTKAVAAGKGDAFFTDATVDGVHARVLTVPLVRGVALQVVRPLDSVDRELGRLRLILLLVSLGGIGLAAVGGALVAETALVPVRRVTGAAEKVASTLDTSERVPEKGRDELARLAVAFNAMLAALQEAIETQKRFIGDASHELLTPVTSLQTNLEVLARAPRLSPAKRRRLLDDLLGELREVRQLVGNLVELARGKDEERRETVQLDEIVGDCIEQARLRYPEIAFEAEIEPAALEGVPERLRRAVWNLLDNAAKWSEPGGKVELKLTGGELIVRDHGPGIADEDKPHVCERFYRATRARSMPGSGLGLAIVRDVAEAHAGSIEIEDAEGGGALLRLRLPGASRPEPDAEGS